MFDLPGIVCRYYCVGMGVHMSCMGYLGLAWGAADGLWRIYKHHLIVVKRIPPDLCQPGRSRVIREIVVCRVFTAAILDVTIVSSIHSIAVTRTAKGVRNSAY